MREKLLILFTLTMIFLIPTSLMSQDWNTVLDLNSQAVKDVCWVNETTAYAVSAIYSNDLVNVKKTSDAGLTWVEQYVGIPQMNYYEIASPNNGGDVFIVGNVGTLIHSDDGGSNWNIIDIGTTIHLRDIFFLSNSIGYISADYSHIWKTTDGGMTWALLASNIPDAGTIMNLCFINELRGFIVGFNYFHETFDGGLTWASVPGFEAVPGEDYQLRDVQFLDENIGYISGDVGMLFKTTDAGATWADKHVDHPDPSVSLFSFKFLDSDPNIGFACGYHGLLIRTEDGGDSWDLMTSDVPGTNDPSGPIFHSLDFYGNKGLLVGPSKILGYEDPTTYPSPQNLLVDNYGFATWEEPLTDELTGYNVYLDDEFEIYTANLEYQFVDLVNGNLYTAGVSSVYDDSGESEIIEVDFIYDPVGTDTNLIPLSTSLHRNYPNPFNPTTTISYSLLQEEMIDISIYNVKGEKIRTIIDEFTPVGNHKVIWNGDDESGKVVSSGVYFYKISTGSGYTSSKKMILLK
jgi:photosystem II stability/assembly factor-like uncharacterized protein